MINTDALTARTLNLDSRLRVSGSAADCILQLAEPVHLQRNSVCWVTGASVPYVWPNVSITNDTLYVEERNMKPEYGPFGSTQFNPTSNLKLQTRRYSVTIPENKESIFTAILLLDERYSNLQSNMGGCQDWAF